MARRMDIQPTWDKDEFMMNVLSAWEYYMNKLGYLEKLSKSMHNRFMNVIGMNGHWTKY